MILRSLAAEGAPFSSQIVTGFSLRSDLRNAIFNIGRLGALLPKQGKKACQDSRSWHANRGPEVTAHGIEVPLTLLSLWFVRRDVFGSCS
jgi:hypothetical protein